MEVERVARYNQVFMMGRPVNTLKYFILNILKILLMLIQAELSYYDGLTSALHSYMMNIWFSRVLCCGMNMRCTIF